MTADDVSTYVVRILEKNVNILKSEGNGPDVALEFRDKFELFGKLSCNLTDKLQSLLYLSENYTSSSDLKQFVNGIVNSWSSINKQERLLYFTFMHFFCISIYRIGVSIVQVCEKYSKIQVGSRTLSGIPLSLLLEKIKRERALTTELLHIHEPKYNREYLMKCYVLLNEIEDLIRNLERSDDKLQQYIAILKLNPFLVKLESVIDAYVSNIEISPIDRAKCPKLDVFPIVAKLLTGELLGDEPMDPYRVLVDNAPKKPVFIIKIKRRTDIPSLMVVETM